MTLATLALVALAGAGAGLLVGLIGVGGGILYAPVLLVLLRAAGVTDPVLTPLVTGTSLLCVLLAASVSTHALVRRGGVDLRLAARVGLAAAPMVVLTTTLVTTQPWYREQTFSVVLGGLLVLTALRLVLRRDAPDPAPAVDAPPAGWRLGVAGAGAGVLSALAGVGGGVVMVPALHGLARLPFKAATATSAAAIVPIAAVGVATYALAGLGADVPPGALGYVDLPRSLALALPAVLTARFGVRLQERLPVRAVRLTFAAFATVVAVRLLLHAAGG